MSKLFEYDHITYLNKLENLRHYLQGKGYK